MLSWSLELRERKAHGLNSYANKCEIVTVIDKIVCRRSTEP